nr:MAG TPA: hypothetical protein [Bacteriophage sp.]
MIFPLLFYCIYIIRYFLNKVKKNFLLIKDKKSSFHFLSLL